MNNSATHGRWSYPKGRDQPKPTEVVDIIVRQYNVVKIKTIKNRNSESRSRGREVERKRKVSRQGFGHSEGKARTQYHPTPWLG